MMNSEAVESKTNLGDTWAWELSDILLRKFFDHIRDRVRGWKKEAEAKEIEKIKFWTDKFDHLYDEIIENWKRVEEHLGKSNRLRGFLYQTLFWLAAVRDYILRKEAEKELRLHPFPQRPFVLPLYEVTPLPWRRMGDFIALPDVPEERKEWGPLLIDVKSSKPDDKKFDECKQLASEHGCDHSIFWPLKKMPDNLDELKTDKRLKTLSKRQWGHLKSWDEK